MKYCLFTLFEYVKAVFWHVIVGLVEPWKKTIELGIVDDTLSPIYNGTIYSFEKCSPIYGKNVIDDNPAKNKILSRRLKTQLL